MAKNPREILSLQTFIAEPDVRYNIEISQVVLIYPIMRFVDDHFIDATGDYDLCMSLDGRFLHFYNRRETTETFAYKFFSINFLSSRVLK